MSTPEVAVVIPYFQREAGVLARALRSIFSQDEPPAHEIIVVDDGSPAPAEQELAGLDETLVSDVRIIHQPNGGPAAARNTGLDAVAWARRVEELGAGEILLTSIDADGTQAGYDLALTRAVCEAVNIPVIASGGAGRLEHFYDVFTKTGADAALAASVFHYGTYPIPVVKRYLREQGVVVRL